MTELKPYSKYKDSGNKFIGEIPYVWNVNKLKSYFNITSSIRVFEKDWKSEGIPFYRARDIAKLNDPSYLPDIFISREHYLSHISLHGPINAGDIIVTAVGTLGQVLLIRNNKEFYFKDGNIIWFQNKGKILPDYVRFLFKSPIIKEQIDYTSNSTTVGTLTINNAKGFEIPVPKFMEQNYIVNYLDQKTTQIDSLIADKERLIELLEEKRQAVITETVTKGLDPDVKMKDSGIEWIGEIPEHWDIVKLKYCVEEKTKKKDTEESLVYLGLENVRSNTGEVIEYNSSKNIVGEALLFNKGDVLFGKLRPYLKKAIFAKKNGCCSLEFLVMTPIKEYLDSRYLLKLLLSNNFMEEINSSTYGSKMPRASWEFIGNMYIPMIPGDEQEKIINYLDTIDENYLKVIKEQKLSINKLREYRESLIYEAVTGKIDLRDYEGEHTAI